ncbi:myoglobin-like [Physella acuta]|uniref:myoglobin-like n=1 Tax=Physella acuta TaxID=109671 RepID=UPI0027DCAEFC|nr:myoglobin-like [Physella acuta]XP_059141282.1 myoglobin-like [Physella acuta]
MMATKEGVDSSRKLDLQKFHVSYDTGLMLKDPLKELPPYFREWNRIAESLPQLVKQKILREEVHKMPLLDHRKLEGYRQKRLAHLQLCFITAGYVWQDGDKGVTKTLPKCVAVPFYAISEELGIKPILGHVDLALANWRLINPSGPYEFENLECLYHLPGEAAGDWFCIVTFMVEFSFAKCLKPLANIFDLLPKAHHQKLQDSTGLNETVNEIASLLGEVTTVIHLMQSSLARMHDKLEAKTFFNLIRPFLGGWGGADNPLPDGLIYEGVSDQPIKMTGGSAAQSTTLQVVDALLGVKHTQDKKDFLTTMRCFMPPDHKSFIEDLENRQFKLRDLVLSTNSERLQSAYNKCVTALIDLRTYHIKIVTKYIVQASQTMNEGNYESLDKKGTGGTSLIPFLKDIRTDTKVRIVPETDTKVQHKRPNFSLKFGAVAVLSSIVIAVAVKIFTQK